MISALARGVGVPPLLRLGRLCLLVGGLGVVAYMIWEMGPGAIWESLRALSWRLLIVLCFPYCVSAMLDTVGWRFTFGSRRAPFGALVGARLAGEAGSRSRPTWCVGGCPCPRAWPRWSWTRRRWSSARAASSCSASSWERSSCRCPRRS